MAIVEAFRVVQGERQAAEARANEAETRANRTERQMLALQFELRKSQLALTEHAESLHEHRAEARMQALQELETEKTSPGRRAGLVAAGGRTTAGRVEALGAVTRGLATGPRSRDAPSSV